MRHHHLPGARRSAQNAPRHPGNFDPKLLQPRICGVSSNRYPPEEDTQTLMQANFVSSRPVVIGLGALGLIPFAAGSLYAVLGEALLGVDPVRVFTAYSAVILSFLSGTLWGKCIAAPASGSAWQLLIFSNVMALLAWAALLTAGEPVVGLSALATGYAATLWIERRYDSKLTVASDDNYLAMRGALTIAVIAMHVLILAAMAWSTTNL